jgi:hypothetical protein
MTTMRRGSSPSSGRCVFAIIKLRCAEAGFFKATKMLLNDPAVDYECLRITAGVLHVRCSEAPFRSRLMRTQGESSGFRAFAMMIHSIQSTNEPASGEIPTSVPQSDDTIVTRPVIIFRGQMRACSSPFSASAISRMFQQILMLALTDRRTDGSRSPS